MDENFAKYGHWVSEKYTSLDDDYIKSNVFDPLASGGPLNGKNEGLVNLKIQSELSDKIEQSFFKSLQPIYKASYPGLKKNYKGEIIKNDYYQEITLPKTSPQTIGAMLDLARSMVKDSGDYEVYTNGEFIFSPLVGADLQNPLSSETYFTKTINGKKVIALGFISGPKVMSMETPHKKKDDSPWALQIPNYFIKEKLKDVKLISFEKLKQNIENLEFLFVWKKTFDYDDPIGNPFSYMDLIENDSITFDSIDLVYFAQSTQVVPGFIICGNVNRDGKKINEMCALTEAVDYEN